MGPKSKTDLEHLIFRRVGRAIGDHGLLQPDDRIAVPVHGDRSSFALLHMLELHRRSWPFDFRLLPVYLKSACAPGKQAAQDPETVCQLLRKFGFAVEVLEQPCETSTPPEAGPCSALSAYAESRKINKVAWAHHLDDFLAVLLKNMFHGGRLASLAVNLPARDTRPALIRPLVYVEGALVRDFALERNFSSLGPGCVPRLDQESALIEEFAKKFPRLRRSMLASLKHVRCRHLLDLDWLERPAN